MLSKDHLEFYAEQVAQPEFDVRASAEKLLGHLHDDDVVAVLERAAAIAREMAANAEAEADRLLALVKLALQAGCPNGVPVIPWLEEHCLIKTRREGTS
jgi:hypothetical protein